MTASVSAPSAFRVSRELYAHSKAQDTKIRAAVRHWGHRTATKVKGNASSGTHAPGRPHIPGTGPGPNVATGDYRRTIGARFSSTPGHYYAYVGTNAPQGRRLEYGFTGQDSLGRSYDQPPFPHFGPGLDWAEPQFVAALGKAVDLDYR